MTRCYLYDRQKTAISGCWQAITIGQEVMVSPGGYRLLVAVDSVMANQ